MEMLEIEVTEDVGIILDRLRRTGLFGATKEEVASRLLSERLRDAEVAMWFRDGLALPPGPHTLARP